jgi:DnaK suppressor protein
MDNGAVRDALVARRAEQRTRLAWMAAEFDEVASSAADANGDDEHDPEGSTVAFERARISALVAAARVMVDRLDAAVERIDHGTYGWCTRCGAAIDPERLAALAEGDTCLACALQARSDGRPVALR